MILFFLRPLFPCRNRLRNIDFYGEREKGHPRRKSPEFMKDFKRGLGAGLLSLRLFGSSDILNLKLTDRKLRTVPKCLLIIIWLCFHPRLHGPNTTFYGLFYLLSGKLFLSSVTLKLVSNNNIPFYFFLISDYTHPIAITLSLKIEKSKN